MENYVKSVVAEVESQVRAGKTYADRPHTTGVCKQCGCISFPVKVGSIKTDRLSKEFQTPHVEELWTMPDYCAPCMI